jgi:maltodextrin utilization protein YvdJ
MFLFEFDQESALATKIAVLTKQLKQDLEDGKIGEGFTVDQLLDYFQKYDVILDVNNLYNMIKVPPLKNVIKNIQGDDIVFVGQEESRPKYDAPESDDKETVAKMAKRAMKI